MKMKRITLNLFLIMLIIFTLGGCKTPKKELKVLVPNGVPLIAIAGVEMPEVNLENVSGPEVLKSSMATKSHDIIIAPITTGAKLYQIESSIYKLDSIITFSNLYIVSKGKLDSIDDLRNKKVIAYGKNTTPGLVFDTAIKDIECEVTYVASINDTVGYFMNDKENYDYMLTGEPTLTNIISKFNLDLNILDLSTLLKDELPLIPQAGIFVNPNSKNRDLISKYLGKVKSNITNLNENPSDYANKVSSKNQWLKELGKNIILKSIPKSNIGYVRAKEELASLNVFFNWLNDNQPELVSGIPDENFYY